MCSGSGTPGSKTTSSGNRGRSMLMGTQRDRGVFYFTPAGDWPVQGGSKLGMGKEIDVSSKVVVVTGSSMGIGEALARIFADHGARVVLLSRVAGRAEAARDRVAHTERTLALSCDVRNREEIDRVLSLTLHHFNRIDVWINNAGHGLLDSVAQ